jgi:hypothetical protein
MDPQATWQLLLEAWSDANWEEVVELAGALLDWLDKEGFAPEVFAPRCLGQDWNDAVVRAACSFALQRAGSALSAPDGVPPEAPFSLTCSGCGNDGPDRHAEALAEGWRRIEYAPALASANFVGLCPNCSSDE